MEKTKKRHLNYKLLIVLGGLLLILILGVALMAVVADKGLSVSTGTCIAADKGSYLVVFYSDPVVMSNRTNNEDMFAGLQTGDKIWVVHDWILESYPAQTGVYMCIKLEDGDASAIPEWIMESLRELGWISGY